MDMVAVWLRSLKDNISILEDLCSSLSVESATVRRHEKFWTIEEHVAHLAEVQPMLLSRLEKFRDEKNPVMTPFIPEEGAFPGVPSLENSLAQFRQFRLRQLELIAHLGDEAFKNEGTHPEYTAYNLPILIRHIILHDQWHMYRMEELWLAKTLTE